MVPGDEGVAALDAAAQAITATMEALQAEHPRIAPQDALVQRLQALAGELPEARWPLFASEDEDEEGTEPAPDVEQASKPKRRWPAWTRWAKPACPLLPMRLLISLPTRLPKMLEPVPSAPDLRTDVAADSGLEVGELTASDDLSRYFDAGWPSVQGEDEPAVAYTGAIDRSSRWRVRLLSKADAAAAPTIETVDDADLTMADDLSPYLDASVLPVDDRDAEELPVSAEVDAIDLNTSLSFDSGSGDDSVIDDAAALPLDSELSSQG